MKKNSIIILAFCFATTIVFSLMKEYNLINWNWYTVSAPFVLGCAFCSADLLIRAVELHQIKKQTKNLKK